MKIGVVTFPGSLDDVDALRAVRANENAIPMAIANTAATPAICRVARVALPKACHSNGSDRMSPRLGSNIPGVVAPFALTRGLARVKKIQAKNPNMTTPARIETISARRRARGPGAS